MARIETVFELKEKVRVKTLGLEGFINAFWVLTDGIIQYQLEWLDARGVVNNRYFGEDELEKA